MFKAPVESNITDKSRSISDLRSVAFCLTSYAGFFRSSELSHITACDVKLFSSYAFIFLESSKTHRFRDGDVDRYSEVRPTDLSCQGLGGIHLSCADQCALR